MGTKKPKKARKTDTTILESLHPKWIYTILALLSLLLYANTLGHDFTLDDAILITENKLTKQGINAIPEIFTHDTFYGFFEIEGKDQLVSGGRYRPLTQAMYAIEYSLFGQNPLAFHFVNIVCYIFCCCSLYFFLIFLLRNRITSYLTIGLLTSLLFVSHPIHTEVVANVKGRDEIMALLLSIWATYVSFKSHATNNLGGGILAGSIFLAALLAKETAIGFLVVAPLAFHLFRSDRWTDVFRATLPIFAGFLVYVCIRTAVIGLHLGNEPPLELMNNPFLILEGQQYRSMTWLEKAPMIIYGLGKYLQLSFFPHPLTHDYYPRYVGILSLFNWKVLLSLISVSTLLAAGIFNFKRRPLVSFAIGIFFCTLFVTSNIVLPIGTNLSERFLFMPSVGICLLLAAGLLFVKNRWSASSMWTIMGVLVLFSAFKTITRNQVWKDNLTLFTTDVHTSSRSAKIQNAAGGELITYAQSLKDTTMANQILDEAIEHLRTAISIHPAYKNAYLLLGNAHFYKESYLEAIQYYDLALQIDPGYPEAITNRSISWRDLGRWYGEKKGDLSNALFYLEKAGKELEDDYETNRLLGVAYGNNGDEKAAIRHFEKALKIKPNEGWTYYNLGLAYLSAGDTITANSYINRAKELNPEIGNR